MLKNIHYLYLVFLLISAFPAISQEAEDKPEGEKTRDFNAVRKGSGILDDSTVMVYGPTTSEYTFLHHIKLNQPKLYTIDTLLDDLERFGERDIHWFRYQDLGVNGTALWPTFYEAPTQIGRRSGFHAYDLYARQPEDMRFFDTKSPFIDLQMRLGGQGRSTVKFDFSRNVNPNWNIGFDIHRITSDKQIGAVRNEGDRNAQGTHLDLYSYYRSPDKKYTHVISYSNFSHTVNETGGVFVGDDTTRVALYQYRDAVINLRNARSFDNRSHFHQYHEYKLREPLEFYLESSVKQQTNRFEDYPLSASADYYDELLIATDSTLDVASFSELSNEIGIKGQVAKFFYNAYLKRRDLSFAYKFLDPLGRVSETYLGGRIRFDLDKKNNLDGHLEVMQTGNYRLAANLNNPFFELSYVSALYMPSLMQNRFFGNHYEWVNDFNSTFTNQIKGRIIVDLPFVKLRPKVNLTTLDNYIFFNEEKRPTQAPSGILISTFGLDLSANFNNSFRIEADARYTELGGDGQDAIRMPKLFISGKVFYEGAWFNNYMPVQLGTNIYYRSGYFGHDYDPITQQFFLQNDFLLEGNLAADLFFNMRVDKVRIFLKMTHINQSAVNDGYMISPFYPGQQRIFDFGVRWIFFD